MTELKSKPVIIIGAPRSGTNMLRDVLNTLPGFHTWPCDEIPYLWRHGNRSHPNDEFTTEMATPAVCEFIRREFNKETKPATQYLVEKTCANSLRPAFVAKTLPEAVFIYILRDGVDAAASAMKRWTSHFDLVYSLAKARYVPVSDVPYYAWQLLKNRLRKARSPEKRLSIWGPTYDGMAQATEGMSVAELSANQWQQCVANSNTQLGAMLTERVCRVRYEDFVADPVLGVRSILAFLGADFSDEMIATAVQGVHRTSVGKAAKLGAEDLKNIRRIVAQL